MKTSAQRIVHEDGTYKAILIIAEDDNSVKNSIIVILGGPEGPTTHDFDEELTMKSAKEFVLIVTYS
jgi:hypothetical protein